MTPSPDQTLLTAVFEQFVKDEYPSMDPDDAFERFAVTQLRKPHELAGPEMEAGIVDGSKDGGIDAFYVFLNGVTLTPDHPFLDPDSEAHRTLARNPRLELLLVQAKNQDSWKESAWEKLLSTLANVLDLSRSDVDLEQIYNSQVVESTGIARTALTTLAPKFPNVSVRVAYVTRATEGNLVDTVNAKASQVKSLLASSLSAGAEVLVENIGAESLYAMAAEPVGTPARIEFRELVRESSSYVGVVSLQHYLSFVRDPATGALREELFDSNVRDFEGDNRVNSAISATLGDGSGVEFWWLNNGVTVLGDEVTGPQKTLTIARPLIVNGLQTSHVLHRSEVEGALHPSRLDDGIVVRVIESTDEEIRDRVIEGTNRQTPVPGAALMATDAGQVKLEEYLKLKGFFYERRKNRYRNLGIAADQRVSMSRLAQVMITVLRGEPDEARARPSSILTSEGGWDSVFPHGMDLDAYVQALRLHNGVQAFLKTDQAKSILDEPPNARFYVLAACVLLRAKARGFSTVNFAKSYSSFNGAVPNQDLVEALTVLARVAKRYQTVNPEMSRDSMFKSAAFRKKYFAAIARVVSARKAAARGTAPSKGAAKAPARKRVVTSRPTKKPASKKREAS